MIKFTGVTEVAALTTLLISFCMLYPVGASAVSMDINAEFNPDPSNPRHNEFVNKTESSGYCDGVNVDCEGMGIFSLSVPVNFYSQTALVPDEDNPRKNSMFVVPFDWRRVPVTHAATGETEIVELRVMGVGTSYYLPVPVEQLTGGGNHNALWKGNSWTYPQAPCVGTGPGRGSATVFASFWKVPEGGVCIKRPLFTIPSFRYSNFQFAYQLKTPNPLTMSTGQYVGALTYSVGPGGDFDMGDVMLPDSSSLTLNFILDVKHTLKVDVPPGGNRVELVPQGGWQSWLQQGRKPTRLFRDQTFNISSSSRFKMQLECQYSQDGNTCSLSNPSSGHFVPLNISVSLPYGLTDAGGRPVNRRRLLSGSGGSEPFQPSFYVDRKPGTLHFEIPSSEVPEMIRPGQSRQYSGSVSVIWDSEI
ncbi:hypothetical protein ACYZUD_29600 [Pseudomonas sp. XS1P51]